MRTIIILVFSLLVFSCQPKETAIDKAIIENLVASGITVIPKDESFKNFKVSMARQKEISNEKWIAIRSIKNNISELNLSKAAVAEKSNVWISEMSNLEMLNLEDCEIGDAYLDKIIGLKKLKKINLNGTKVSADRMAKLMDEMDGVEVLANLDEAEAKLSPPLIEAAQEIFNEELEIKLLVTGSKMKIYYTLDGTEPNESADLYKAPFKIKKSTLVKAAASKTSGQLGSIGVKQFVQTNAKVKKISLVSPPSEKYKAQGAQSLVDFKRGGSNFSTQFWLGYQGEHLTTVIELEEAQKIKGVFIGGLQDQNNWIHYPAGVKIWGSKNKRDYKLIKEDAFGDPPTEGVIEGKFFKTNFDPVEVKFVKVQVLSQLKNPSWHMSAGEPCWVFVDEIVVESE